MALRFSILINTSMKIKEVITTEQPRTCQIQQEEAIRLFSVRGQVQPRKVAQIQPSQAHQQKIQKKRKISTRAIPDQIKHKLIQDRLTKQFMRNSNIIKPTSDDVRIARDRAEARLKRSDLGYQRGVNQARLKH